MSEDDLDELPLPEPPIACPECESPHIRRRRKLLAFAVVAAIAVLSGIAFEQGEAAFFFIAAAAVFALVADRWVCEECGESWK